MNNYILLIGLFVFYYPIIMSIVWISGGIIFYLKYEFRKNELPPLSSYPAFSIVIPCHNEEKLVSQTVVQILDLAYPDYEIILVDDGSTDNTAKVLEDICNKHDNVRVLYLRENHGKSAALNLGCLMARNKLIVTIDADGILAPGALEWIAWHFQQSARVGAVAGNPKVLNRTTLLARIQAGEFASIVSLIKRSQRILGKILTVSGVIAAFRKEALVSVGFWDTDMVTDDIDITWKLEKAHWDVRFEPRAICWIFVPETLRGLWRQRLRWASGGVEVLVKHFRIWGQWRQRRLWPIYIEYVVSICWSYSFLFLLILTGIYFLFPGNWQPSIMRLYQFFWSTWAVVMLLCMLQFVVSFYLERNYGQNLFKYLLGVVWYPFVYWLINALTIAVAVPKVLLTKRKRFAVWVSPDRGLDKL